MIMVKFFLSKYDNVIMTAQVPRSITVDKRVLYKKIAQRKVVILRI